MSTAASGNRQHATRQLHMLDEAWWLRLPFGGTQASEDEREKAEAQFKLVGEAYAVLSDPAKRARYDQGEPFKLQAGASALLPALSASLVHVLAVCM